ncbi:hypothetical protein HPB48_001966 [Haemaphysalis longicornis]|uniref:Uncharacterized protein n=1 Tax=Haemaphysalis longicornis TaxID=44386 RepID=A0A9J6G5X2_HAELO|nr:hypothetical protein HPB48_001966 [Haemaphysalis longicornis]
MPRKYGLIRLLEFIAPSNIFNLLSNILNGKTFAHPIVFSLNVVSCSLARLHVVFLSVRRCLIPLTGMVDAMDQSVGDIGRRSKRRPCSRTPSLCSVATTALFRRAPASNHGYNWPFRGGKETLWEGGVRVAAFLWGPRLLPRRRVSQQLMHVTDWLPTLYSAAGGDTKQLGPLDGFDMWQALTVGKPSPRTEILHNIDNQAGVAALRHGQYKLLIGSYGTLDARFEIPGASLPYGDLDPLMRQSRTAAVLKRLYGKKQVFNNAADWRRQATVACRDVVNANFASGSSYYLFNVAHDPCEQINLADERPAVSAPL